MKSKTKLSILCSFAILALIQFTSCKKEASNITDSSLANISESVTDSIPDSSLVAWYNFKDGDLSDLSGNNNNIVYCTAKVTTGRNGTLRSAYLFNGTGNYMQVPNSPSLNPQKITMAVQFKPKGFYSVGTTRIFMKGIDDQSSGDYFLGYNQDGSMYGAFGDNQYQSAGVYTPANTLQLNTWYKLIYTYDGSQAKIYIGGKLVSSTTVSAVFTPNTSPLRIGKTGRTDFPYFFNGIIDEIRIYNTALTASQVSKLNMQIGK